VFEESGQSYVFAIVDGKLAKPAVQLGFRDEAGGLVEVTGGLATGTTVVRVRMTGLKPGTPVLLLEAAARS
jgi:hypothetical protein